MTFGCSSSIGKNRRTRSRTSNPKTASRFLSPLIRDATAFNQFAKEGIPRTYLISRDGAILFQTLGYAETGVYQREMKTLRRLINEELKRTP